MSRFIVAISTPPHGRIDWAGTLREAGYEILACPLQGTLPDLVPDAWVVALDARQQPLRLSFWLAQLAAPVVLITPHLVPAEVVCAHVPALRVICHPFDALAGLGALVAMAHTMQSGTLVVDPARATVGIGGRV